MENLKKCELFKNFSDTNINDFVESIDGCLQRFNSKNFIYVSGNKIDKFGIIIDGTLEVVNITANGDKYLMSTLKTGDLFCESACFTEHKKLPFSIIAKEDCLVYMIDYTKLFNNNIMSQSFYPTLMNNLLTLLAQNNILKAQKIDILSRKTTEEKVLTFLSLQYKLHNSKTFFIPFNREEMATYLAVDRSALSLVLSKMSKQNIIKYNKNKFTLLF